MNDFKDFDSDSDNEANEVVAESNFRNLGNHSNVFEEMAQLKIHSEGVNYNSEGQYFDKSNDVYQSKLFLIPLLFPSVIMLMKPFNNHFSP